MRFTDREKLTVMEIDKDQETVEFDVLERLILKRPSNMIYCVDKIGGVILGIISMGDIWRAHDAEKDFVSVNKRFTKLNGFEYMRARRLFLENEKINALPIVDSENRLVGDYSRWDDGLLDSVFEMFDDERNVDILKNDIIRTVKKVALVKPCGLFPRKKAFMDKYRKKLEKIGFDTEVVGREDLAKFSDGNNYIVFADEDELYDCEWTNETVNEMAVQRQGCIRKNGQAR